ncbi:MAG: hypothetical protein V4488_17485 [Pseudomonadota bacterium]
MKSLQSQHHRRQALFSLAALTAVLALAGCAAPPRSQHVDRVKTVAMPAPPPAIAEVIPPAPYVDSYWIAGHWTWDKDEYIWANGHWEQARPEMVYQQAYWNVEHGGWVFHQGRWVQLIAEPRSIPMVVTVAPPAPRVEVVRNAPGPNHVWIGGYWQWSGGQHNWVAGHWEARRAGYFWVPGHWLRVGNGWRFSGGYWQRY